MGCGASNSSANNNQQQQQQQPAAAPAAAAAPPPAEPEKTKGARPPAARLPSRTAAKKADWEAIKAKLPVSRSANDFDKRTTLFRQFDPNGNGYLSLAEVDKGIRDVLQVEEIFDCKPVIMRAFQAAKNSRKKAGKPTQAEDYVERTEFRMLLVYLKRYFEIWQMFDEADASDDRRITLEEFKRAVPQLQEWGMDIDNADASFAAIDKNKGGFVLFDEFSEWVLDHQLQKEVADDAPEAPAAPPAHAAPAHGGALKGSRPPSNAVLQQRRSTTWDDIMAKLPTERSSAEMEKRAAMFRQFDPNGNGYLSLAEVDKGVKEVLGIDELFDCKPVIMRAFQAAKNARKRVGKGAPQGDDYVEKTEFRLLLVYLKRYFQIWQVFDDVDSSDDRRITKEELDRAVPLLQKSGVHIADTAAAFSEMDTNKGGFVLFDEFSAYCINKNCFDDDDDA